MSTFWILVLFIIAFIETVSLFIDPVSDVEKAVKEKVLEERDYRTRRRTTSDDTGYRGCLGCVFLLISIVVTYIITPIFTITVIVKNIGYQPFAFINLLIVLITWVWTVILLYKKKPKTDILNEEDKDLTNKTDETKKPKFTRILLKILSVVQTVYFWYLFLVVINVIK